MLKTYHISLLKGNCGKLYAPRRLFVPCHRNRKWRSFQEKFLIICCLDQRRCSYDILSISQFITRKFRYLTYSKVCMYSRTSLYVFACLQLHSQFFSTSIIFIRFLLVVYDFRFTNLKIIIFRYWYSNVYILPKK